MRHLLFVLSAITVLSSSAEAQKIRFTDSANIWLVESACTCEAQVYRLTFGFEKDSVINGMHYRLLSADQRGGYIDPFIGWVREDTVLKKVFFKGFINGVVGAPADTAERTLYNYNLAAGDTIRTDAGTKHFRHFVQRLDSVIINGIYHKVWQMAAVHGAGLEWSKSYLIIEGIGSTDDPLFPAYPYVFEAGQRMYCFRQGSLWPRFSATPDWLGMQFNNSCSLTGVPATFTEKGHTGIVVPNPARAGAEIRLPGRIAAGTLKLYNSSGTVIASIAVSNTAVIPLPGSLSLPGVYFYRVIDVQSGGVMQGRFIYE